MFVVMMEERRKGFRKHCSKCSRIVLGNSVLLPGRATAVRWQYVVSDDGSAMAVRWQCRGTAEESVADAKQSLCCQMTSGSIHFQHRFVNCVQLRGGQDAQILAAEMESCAPFAHLFASRLGKKSRLLRRGYCDQVACTRSLWRNHVSD